MSFRLTLGECTEPLQATLSGDDIAFTGVSIDTRTLQPGDLYVAIRGERFDGHDFLSAAKDAGAVALMVHKDIDSSITSISGLPFLKVADTQQALGQLGRYWARRFKLPTIAITGSNGKTTVKELISSILRQLGPILSTKGNLNNELGVPLTLLQMRFEHQYAVIEMGASHAGEIARLVALAEPDIAIVTNVGTAHLEGFGSVEGIAAAKSEIYQGLPAKGYAIVNADDAFTDTLSAAASHCNSRTFGFSDNAQVQGIRGDQLRITSLDTTIAPRYSLSGDHNTMNALAAVAAVQCLDVQNDTIIKGLEMATTAPGRLEKKAGYNDAVIIDDSYNANPDSTQSAIKVLSVYKGKRFLVLGDMAELGAEAEKLHLLIGRIAGAHQLDGFWTTGELASYSQKAFRQSSNNSSAIRGGHFTDQESLIENIKPCLSDDVTILIKGSRSAGMERIVEAIMPASVATSDGVALGMSQ